MQSLFKIHVMPKQTENAGSKSSFTVCGIFLFHLPAQTNERPKALDTKLLQEPQNVQLHKDSIHSSVQTHFCSGGRGNFSYKLLFKERYLFKQNLTS